MNLRGFNITKKHIIGITVIIFLLLPCCCCGGILNMGKDSSINKANLKTTKKTVTTMKTKQTKIPPTEINTSSPTEINTPSPTLIITNTPTQKPNIENNLKYAIGGTIKCLEDYLNEKAVFENSTFTYNFKKNKIEVTPKNDLIDCIRIDCKGMGKNKEVAYIDCKKYIPTDAILIKKETIQNSEYDETVVYSYKSNKLSQTSVSTTGELIIAVMNYYDEGVLESLVFAGTKEDL